ncbi:MAG: glycosyltransferase, partial [Nitrospiraceae bacterium]
LVRERRCVDGRDGLLVGRHRLSYRDDLRDARMLLFRETNEEVREAAAKDADINLLLLNPGSDLEINALQRSAAIVIQKSLREGFGITVAEAMWKGKPVIAAETGGISLQVRFGQTGYTVNSVEGTAFYARYLLSNPSVAEEMGRRGREVARQYFLITRHVGEYLSLMLLMGRS